jgi:hypothetical protein
MDAFQNYLHHFLFGYYPYICLTVFLCLRDTLSAC